MLCGNFILLAFDDFVSSFFYLLTPMNNLEPKIRRAGSGYYPPARRAAHISVTCYFVVRLIIAAGRPLAVTASSIVPALRPARTAISALPSKVMRLPVP